MSPNLRLLAIAALLTLVFAKPTTNHHYENDHGRSDGFNRPALLLQAPQESTVTIITILMSISIMSIITTEVQPMPAPQEFQPVQPAAPPQIGTATSSSVTTSSAPLDCQPDNCLRQFIREPRVTAFCATYNTTENTSPTGIPYYLGNCDANPAHVSSACSCIAIATPPSTQPSTTFSTSTTSTASGITSSQTIAPATAPTPPPTTCHQDNCLRQFFQSLPQTSQFCATYTMTANTVTTNFPDHVSQCNTQPTSISSACSCIVPASLTVSEPCTSTEGISVITSSANSASTSEQTAGTLAPSSAPAQSTHGGEHGHHHGGHRHGYEHQYSTNSNTQTGSSSAVSPSSTFPSTTTTVQSATSLTTFSTSTISFTTGSENRSHHTHGYGHHTQEPEETPCPSSSFSSGTPLTLSTLLTINSPANGALTTNTCSQSTAYIIRTATATFQTTIVVLQTGSMTTSVVSSTSGEAMIDPCTDMETVGGAEPTGMGMGMSGDMGGKGKRGVLGFLGW
ncbi:hypothetical protein G7Y89_g12852 [Cudoniella acicularis]|uniref:Extracellular membrane protein CFEM domain-containing protein n=1 Tax=Cudoniella acicularis TaxID=354080 RepID=A0A8H4RAM9_9HELO|nr:hypothetical protein G7Y89_g12852 [Cudoniella acicularis]